jgi:tRNA(Ile)-lysidine synthase
LVAALYHTEFAFFATDSFTLYAGNSKVLVQSIDDNFIEEISIKNIAMLENLFKLSFKEQFTSETIKNIPSDCFVIESGILEFPLLVRNWIAGDSFYPLGMNGKKKVSDFLNDLKLNPVEKQNVRLLINKNQEILWIIGYRADNRFRVQNFEEELIKIEAI